MEGFFPDTNSPSTNRVIPILDKVTQFSLLAFAAFSMFSISITQISFATGALSWVLKVHLTQTWKELRGTRVGIAILCFCLAGILSITTSVDSENSIKLLKKLIQFIIFFWVANAVQDEKQRDLLVKLVIVAGVATALNGLIPFFSASFTENSIKGVMSKESTFSAILMFSGLVALARFLFNKPKEYWVLGNLGVIIFALLLTMARQAWLGFLVGAIFLLFCWNKKYLLVMPLFLAGLLFFGPAGISKRVASFTNLQDNSVQARVSLWEMGWETFKDHPITGCGYKCVDSIHAQYPDPSGWVAYYRGMHSNPFQLLVDSGIAGLGFWLFIWMAYFTEIFKRLRTLAKDTFSSNSKGLLIGSSAAILAYLAGGFFESSIYDSEVSMLLYFLMGLSLTMTKKSPKAR